MICKFFEINKYINKFKYFLFYEENEGLKQEVIKTNFKKFNKENTYKYTEKELINSKEFFFETINSKSFFENEKLILISDVTDKILNLMEEVVESNLDDVVIILSAKRLEKRSKIRNFFEKNKNGLCIPFYKDTNQALITIAQKFLKENNVNFSQENLNLIIERSQGDRISLKNELEKINNLNRNKKKINFNDILKLTNLSENYSAGELVDNCLSKNKKKTLNILNENIPSIDDNILILKTFLYKLKRLRKLRINLDENKDIDKTISSFKPPIFWKDKDTLKKQLKIWELDDIQNFIVNINYLESLIKKKPLISNQIVNNMILEKFANSNILT
ncbi:DNA polymerase III subunit delta [Pelagibacterales bacterium SAG-MED13]|nr:DNA polymerase III subunit delta [Pelagibacterales bacterium SAG-MED13]|tara:strand:+ start:516 stop:1514 length:999 start_codon:yes stop_codon:yes gene_type:complete